MYEHVVDHQPQTRYSKAQSAVRKEDKIKTLHIFFRPSYSFRRPGCFPTPWSLRIFARDQFAPKNVDASVRFIRILLFIMLHVRKRSARNWTTVTPVTWIPRGYNLYDRLYARGGGIHSWRLCGSDYLAQFYLLSVLVAVLRMCFFSLCGFHFRSL